MARARNIRVSALNITFLETTKHNDAQLYQQLMTSLFDAHEYVPIRGDQYMLIGSLDQLASKNGIMRGSFYAMTRVDRMNWFNVAAHRPASPKERVKIVVPENMAANYKEFPFEFFSKDHRLVFLQHTSNRSLSPRQAQQLIGSLTSLSSIKKRFGKINVIVEQEPAQLDMILKAKNLRALNIFVLRPNAGLGGLDRDVNDKLAEMNAASVELNLKAEPDAGLKPDKDTKDIARVALSNGEVNARVRDGGVTTDISTKKFPISEVTSYDPGKETLLSAMKRAASALLSRLKGNAGN